MFGLRLRLRPGDGACQLLLGPSEMERALAKERARCDRYCQYFSLIVIRFNRSAELSVDSQVKLLARFLDSRLRITDEKGHLRNGGVGALLPMTDLVGANFVLEDIRQFAASSGLSIESDVFPYSGHDGLEPSFDSREKDLFNQFKSDSEGSDSSTRSEVEQVIRSANTESSIGTIKRRIDNPVRADSLTQSTSVGANDRQVRQFCSTPFPIWKRATDVCLSSIGILVASPFILLAAIGIKLTSKGPILFRQLRAGQFGEPFQIYKLRTMVVDAEELKHLLQDRNERDGPAFKIKHDPRVTRIGRLLRNTGLDELPQLINVLKGDMSIVGPRPLPIGEENQCASWQQRRLDTKPGLTCTWQISKSRKIAFSDWMRLDLKYGIRRGPFVDAWLMLRTVAAVFMGKVGH